MQIKPKLDLLGVALIAVGNGSIKWAKKFRRSVGFTGAIYTDPDADCFRAMNLPRLSTWQALKRFINGKFFAIYKSTKEKFDLADTEGDGLQTGGVFVVGPGAGRPLSYWFKEVDEDVDEFADLNAILMTAGWTPEMDA